MKMITPWMGIKDGTMHILIPEMLAALNVADTPENREQGLQMAMKIMKEKYPNMPQAAERREFITCPKCGKTSYHPKDVRNRYCGHCHEFHDGKPQI